MCAWCWGAQVNWPVLWTPRRRRGFLRVAGYVLLIVTIAFPVGIFTGDQALLPA